jgi:hypothetical protein
MLGAASIVTGMIAGIGFSYLMPILISTPGDNISFSSLQVNSSKLLFCGYGN